MNSEYEYMVCVNCTTYNHGRYVRKCLDGFVMQQTDFKFIVVVVDDASTDNTPSIITEYATKYSGIIHPILLKENHYSLKKNKSPYWEPYNKKSKYVAFCEGDDYWTDPHKLQKQVDVLEIHPDCKVCVHKVEKVFENGESRKKFLPSFDLPTGRIKSRQFIKLFCVDYPFQTNSYIFTSYDYIEYRNSNTNYRKVAGLYDVSIMLYFGQLANAYYINESMSCYRVGGIGSHNDRVRVDPVYRESIFLLSEAITKEYDVFTNYKYHDECMLRLNKYKYDRVVYSHFAGDITTEQYEKEIVKKQYRYFFRRNTPFKARLLTYMNVYTPRLGRFVKKHLTHQQ